MNEIKWEYGENSSQCYYEATLGKKRLCVLRVKGEKNWTGYVDTMIIHDKTRNDKQRRSQGLPLDAPTHMLYTDHMLGSSDPDFVKERVIYAAEHGVDEVETVNTERMPAAVVVYLNDGNPPFKNAYRTFHELVEAMADVREYLVARKGDPKLIGIYVDPKHAEVYTRQFQNMTQEACGERVACYAINCGVLFNAC